MGRISVQSVVIPISTAVSGALNLLLRPDGVTVSNNREPSRVIRIGMPAAWTAASLRIQVQAFKDDTWRLLTNSGGTVLSLTAAADSAIYLTEEVRAALHGAYAIRFLSDNGSGTPVNQAAERTLQVALEGLG